ncbi:MAG TPA: EcsC family protein [Flexivirga sp.]|uniref:EcsC family protein n=1 Tax=Flexivirga sp. TaxID=1962927 RepID=UPI002CCF4FA7|nr:EcsC family protein [Flexivirga sp.]HWC20874.1 EcsC family protein [Flexivirga sp.]
MFDRKKKSAKPVPLDKGPLGSTALTLSQRLMSVGIDGKAGFDSAREVAQAALHDYPADPERAIDHIISQHRRLAASAGFVTSLGGFATMAVALPVNLVGFYLLNTRMVAAIAHVRGYDLTDQGTRTAILLTLVGGDADDLLKKAGVVSTGRLANLAASQLPPPAVMVVNKAVGFRLVSQLGDKLLTKLGKGIPVAGGVIGAGLDAFLLSRIAKGAKKEFPPTDRALRAGRR